MKLKKTNMMTIEKQIYSLLLTHIRLKIYWKQKEENIFLPFSFKVKCSIESINILRIWERKIKFKIKMISSSSGFDNTFYSFPFRASLQATLERTKKAARNKR